MLEISTLLKLEISSFRRVDISSFRKVEIKRKSRWIKLLLQLETGAKVLFTNNIERVQFGNHFVAILFHYIKWVTEKRTNVNKLKFPFCKGFLVSTLNKLHWSTIVIFSQSVSSNAIFLNLLETWRQRPKSMNFKNLNKWSNVSGSVSFGKAILVLKLG